MDNRFSKLDLDEADVDFERSVIQAEIDEIHRRRRIETKRRDNERLRQDLERLKRRDSNTP